MLLLAVDFDKGGWREDAVAFLETCRGLSLPAAIERSRSGRGAHVWLFFEEAIPAALARRLGAHVITETIDALLKDPAFRLGLSTTGMCSRIKTPRNEVPTTTRPR